MDIPFAAVAVELPASVEGSVVAAVDRLPHVSVVCYEEPETDRVVYIPTDPCDALVEAIRSARMGRIPVHFIDAEVGRFEGKERVLPDEFVIGRLGLDPYIQAVWPHLGPPPDEGSESVRETTLAARVFRLARSVAPEPVLFVFGLDLLPGLVERRKRREILEVPDAGIPPWKIWTAQPDPKSLYHILGEMPYLAYRYERDRHGLEIGGRDITEDLKQLLLAARTEYRRRFPDDMFRVGPQRFQTLLTYARNLCLVQSRCIPSLYELAVAAKGVIGDTFARELMELAKYYPYLDFEQTDAPVKMTDRQIRWEEEVRPCLRRPQGLSKEWKSLKLRRDPDPKKRQKWKSRWDPYQSCSWPPEDERIENLAGYVRDRALQMVGISQIRAEEFTSSMKDGLHVRETIRNLHLGKVYVKEEPQVRGQVGAVVFLFEPDPDGTRYPLRMTWLAEHENESTLAFYATHFMEDMVGPGIGRSFYGGASFLYPPQLIPDVWRDPRFQHARDEAESLVFSALFHSQDRYVTLVSKDRPTARMQAYARRQGRRLLFMPISMFSRETLQKLRIFHVLNGQEVRSWARDFIR
jgi:hypothetical protein